MPNWCNCELIVSGDAEDIERFKETVSSNDRAIEEENILPTPDHLNGREEYEWRVRNWGTKWGFGEMHTISTETSLTGEDQETIQRIGGEEEIESILYGFSSAWSPPSPLVKKMGEMFPELDFVLKYEEPGMCFYGKLVVKEGNVMEEWNEDLSRYMERYQDEGTVLDII